MQSVTVKRACATCEGAGVVSCDGCQKSFCNRHLTEHRKELSQELNDISAKYDLFREDLERRNDPEPILSRIDAWEKESIKKIRVAAETARVDLQEYVERTNDELDKIFTNIATEQQSSQELNDYTEIDLMEWTEQLKDLQKSLMRSAPIGIVDDEKTLSFIRFIKIKYEQPIYDFGRIARKHKKKAVVPQQVISSNNETFHKTVGRATLSERGLIATCSGYSSICGNNQYSNGNHRIRFRILARKNNGIFFGIIHNSQEMTARSTELLSVFGWRDFDRAIVNGTAYLRADKDKIIRTSDEITLTLDCDKREIILTHHRTKRSVQLSIDPNECPFPWRLLVASFGDDCVGILH